MKTKTSVEKTFNELEKLCNHILKLSKINSPECWKKFGKPHITVWIAKNVNSKNHLFNLEWTDNVKSVSTAFHYKDAEKSITKFKEERQNYITHLKKLGIYKKYKI